MEGEPNQTAFDVNVYFVVPEKYKKEDDCDEDMWEAYNVSYICQTFFPN